MQPQKLQTIFLLCLNAALRDERWRAFIGARLHESELPVIDLLTNPTRRPAPQAVARPMEKIG